MIALLELIITKIYRAIYRVRIYWIAKRYGYRITSFEWLPDDDSDDSVVRIIPTDDGFDHGGDDCSCVPLVTYESSEDGEFMLIQHKEMISE
jgi:hypothetical protein